MQVTVYWNTEKKVKAEPCTKCGIVFPLGTNPASHHFMVKTVNDQGRATYERFHSQCISAEHRANYDQWVASKNGQGSTGGGNNAGPAQIPGAPRTSSFMQCPNCNGHIAVTLVKAQQ